MAITTSTHWPGGWIGMKVLCVASRKGGSGKTVVTRHLAVAALRSCMGRVAVVDLDLMRGLSRWWQRRPDDGLELIQLAPNGLPMAIHEDRSASTLAAAGQLSGAIPALRTQGYGLMIIDTPPAADEVIRLAVQASDLVVVPVRPSPDASRCGWRDCGSSCEYRTADGLRHQLGR
jgi:chromosome partitioning protein